MNGVLLVDIGSTYTKLTAVDMKNERIISTAKSLTTADTDLLISHIYFQQWDCFLINIQIKQ